MQEIPLTQGKVALVDDRDYAYLSQFNWFAIKQAGGRFWYAVRNKQVNGKSVNIRMHREVMSVTDPLILIDHKDHDGLNCQRDNLKTANKSQNGANRLKKENSSSKYLGVILHKRDKKYYAAIRGDGTIKHLGVYKDEILAAKAYDIAAKEKYGEFANLNFKGEEVAS